MRNNGELRNIEYLPTKSEYVKYLQNTNARTSGLFGPFKRHYIRFKQAQDHEKQWRIEEARVSTPQTRICRISQE